MHIGTAMVHLHIHWCPCQNPKYYKSSEPLCLFANPIVMPVKYIYIYIYIYISLYVHIYCYVKQCLASGDSLFTWLELKRASAYVYYI